MTVLLEMVILLSNFLFLIYTFLIFSEIFQDIVDNLLFRFG